MNRAFIFREGPKENWREPLSALIQLLKEVPSEKTWEVVVRPFVPKKTNDQRAFFHVLCREYGMLKGNSADEIKQMCKAEAFGTREVTVGEFTFTVIKSSEDANRDEYSELIEACYRLAAFDGFVLPPARKFG